MFLTKIKMVAAVLLCVAAVAGGTTGLVAYRTQAEEPKAAQLPSAPKKDQTTPESPKEAPDQPASAKKPPVLAAPKEDDRIQPGDRLAISVTPTLPTFPIQGEYTVDAGGRVRLGARYGTVEVKGLTLKEAEVKITDHLARILNKPVVSVDWVEPPNREDRIRPGDLLNIQARPRILLSSVYQVEPSGKVPLGSGTGRVDIKGLTLEEAEKVIQKRLERDAGGVPVSVQVTRPLAGVADAELEQRVRQLEKEVHSLRSLVEELQRKGRR